MKYTGDYFIGLDIGTDSVGWAVTDTNYRILKANQKALWGIRLFDSAETAAERRMFRTNRRRNERKKQRIQWLQMLFDEEICRVDPAFFQRLKESKFEAKDKQGLTGKDTLFADKDFTDKEYHLRYPTIYHLRKALLTEEGPFDVRLVYLGLHHIIKNRGHFLLDAEVTGGVVTFSNAFHDLKEYLWEQHEVALELHDASAFENHLKDRTITKTRKKALLKADAGLSRDDVMQQAVVELLAGGTVKLAALYQDDSLKKAEPASITLAAELNEGELTALLGERIELIVRIKAVYDWAVLDDILGGQAYLSLAKVEKYEKHKRDLARLKKEIKTHLPDRYAEIFHKQGEKHNNYAAYSGNGTYRCEYEDFKKYLLGQLKSIKNPSQETEEIRKEVEQGTFLPKQVGKDNSVIPNQVHRKELQDILARAERYLPFLAKADGEGLTVSQKILSIFDFRIPYYVGPLNQSSPRAWIERTEERIYPWNFERVVNQESSAEKFIMRMTSKCTYIHEDVLPKDSLLYSEFMVLNELNNLRINGKRVSTEIKIKIYRDLFMKHKKVTRKRLLGYLMSNGICREESEVSGIDNEIKSSLRSYHVFQRILAATGDTEMVEDIIRRIVLFGEDRNLLRNYIKRTYGKVLSEEDIQYVCKQKFSGWGKLSREFLTGIYHTDAHTGEVLSIIEMMRKTNCNLMELLSSRFTFLDAITAYKQEHMGAATNSIKEMVDETYASPAIKRSILQTVAIVDELVKIMGKRAPKRIFVEMARGEEEKKRTVSRKNTLMELYEKCGEEASALFAQMENRSDGELRRDKLYLYYTQLGKCMYSGKPIDLDLLDTDYDIDHIYPQSKVKDDSLDNRVLVYRPLNEAKGDKYPIDQKIRAEQSGFWYMLKEKGLISARKYERLIRSTAFAEEELAGFINRQLVETRQSAKIVADILEKRYGSGTEIVYVKAGNVSDFRHQADRDEHGKQVTYDFVKCREINDYHHAKDAYLNIVVGNVYHVKFTRNPLNYIKSAEGAKYSLNRLFERPVKRNGEIAWLPGEDGSMAVVRRTMRKNNVLFTRKAYEASGGLYDQNILPKRNGQAPIKSSDLRMTVERYGGYNKLAGSYFCLVEHRKGKKRVRSLEAVYLMYEGFYRRDPKAYCEQVLGLSEPEILVEKIRICSLISYDGFCMHIAGRSNKQIIYRNATPLIVPGVWHSYIKSVEKFLERIKGMQEKPVVTKYDRINKEENLALYRIFEEKLNGLYGTMHTTPKQVITKGEQKFAELDIYQQCETLRQILNLFTCNAAASDLTPIGGSKKTGLLLTTKNLPDASAHTVKIINQSITGVFEQEVDLLGTDFTPQPAQR